MFTSENTDVLNSRDEIYLVFAENSIFSFHFILFLREARWPSGRALDSGARGRGLDPHSGRRVVSFTSQKVLVIPGGSGGSVPT